MKAVLLIILSGLTIVPLAAQQAVSSAGGNATGAGGAVSYTVGQVAYTFNTGTNGSVTQGVQQPYEISVVTTLKEIKEITLECSVYPNPASGFLKIKLSNTEDQEMKPENLRYSLYDISGKFLLENKLDGIETTIQMEGLPSSTYILKIIQINPATLKELKTFKIINH
jgi:hypothetical protein